MAVRRAIVHVGTHKTGTKTLQKFYSDNLDSLRRAGLYVPDAGRIMISENQATPGHHGLASALASGDKTILEEFEREIGTAASPSFLISSEELHPLAAAPELLSGLQRRIVALGYDPVAILYLRPQADYAESMYAEIAKTKGVMSYPRFLASIMEHGALYPEDTYRIYFDYSRLVEALGAVFGNSNVVVRAYDDVKPADALVTDFLRVVATIRGPIDPVGLSLHSPHINRRSTFAAVINNIYQSFAATTPETLSPWHIAQRLEIEASDPRLDAPFSVTSYEERETIRSRFSGNNQLVEAMSGTRVVDREIASSDPRWAIAAFQRRFLDAALALWFK